MNWGIWSYQLPLRHPLMVLGEENTVRRGFIIGKRIGDHWKYGEAAPLPSFHKISLQQVFEQLLQHCQKQVGSLSSVAQFAIDMLDINPDSSHSITVNALSSGDIHQDKDISSCIGFLKVKVGRKSLQEDRDHLRKLRDHFSNDLCFRLDANRLWDRDQAQQFINANQDLNIEYIEEPTRDVRDIQHLTGASIALDESLEQDPQAHLFSQVTHLIIKPTLQGGVSGALEWATTARTQQKTIILSSTFESSLGIWALGQLAATISPSTAHGLDTLRWFSHDLTRDHLRKTGDHLFVPKDPPTLEFTHLKLEAHG